MIKLRKCLQKCATKIGKQMRLLRVLQNNKNFKPNARKEIWEVKPEKEIKR